MKEVEFKKRYVLGEGFPWPDLFDKRISLSSDPSEDRPIHLNIPNALWNETGVPKYRLVLEKIEREDAHK